MSAQQTQMYQTVVTAPLHIQITAEIHATGVIEHLDGTCDDDLSVADEARLVRAVQFCAAALQKAAAQGHLIEDLIVHLPTNETFAIEMSILRPLAELQGDILRAFQPSAIAGRA
jgi:hypothetical protein